MNPSLIFVILALATARLTLILVRDDIFEPIRKLIWKYSPAESVVGRVGYTDGAGKPVEPVEAVKAGWWGQVISCPDCSGVYVATVVFLLWLVEPVATSAVAVPFALSMVTSLIARKY